MNSASPWGDFQFAPEITIPLFLLLIWYFRSSYQKTRNQKIFAVSAVLTTLAVVVTPIGARALDFFSLHMYQHITLLMLAGPLFVLATPQELREKLQQNKIFYALTNPWLAFLLYATMMIGVHLSGPHLFIMENQWAHHYLEVPAYLIIPYLFYFNLIDPNLTNRRISPALSVINLFLMMVPETLTGFAIYVTHESAYNFMYDINDQRGGGTIMWSGGMIIDAAWISLAVYHWYKSEELKSKSL